MQWIDRGQGYLRTNLRGEQAYQSFVPTPLSSLNLELSNRLVYKLTECARKIGELKGTLQFVPNGEMYLAMYVRKEALLSAQIEGTQCTFDDLLDPDNDDANSADIADVVNYVYATTYAVERMQELPLSMRLLREVHGVLLAGVRGEDKQPGEVRTSQNWIGPTGSTIANANYVPPNPEDMAVALSEMERFIHGETLLDPIVKAALVHYQFETIHPFLDGNGRLGRLLITLTLLNDGVLSDAMFYPSYQFKLKRAEYYDRLTAVRERGEYLEWIDFFCSCLTESAVDALASLGNLVSLKERDVETIRTSMGRMSSSALRCLDLLCEHPIVDTGFVADSLDISWAGANNLVARLCDLGILRPLDVQRRRNRKFLYAEYLGILRQGSDPL